MLEPDVEQVRTFWLRAVGLAALTIVAGSVVLILCLPNGPAAAFGLVLGGTTSILRFNVRYKALRAGRDAKAFVRLRLGTYLLNAAVLAAAFGRPEMAWPWSTVLGLFVMNATVVAAELLTPRRNAPADGAGAGAS